jgi:two-component system, OmpR family, phosphate regulon response regulator PhoB
VDSAEEEIRVLFVEDDPALAEMYRLKLELDGYLVDVARSGAEALARLATTSPDLVLLDVRLPRVEAILLLEELRSREQTRELPVVVLGSQGKEEWRDRARQLGALEWSVRTAITPGKAPGEVQDWTRRPAPAAAASTRQRERG